MNKINVCVEFGVNYVTHFYTLAGAGFYDDVYKAKYGNTVSEDDIRYLSEHSKYISFQNMDHGMFTSRFYFVPSFFNMKTKKEYTDYMNLWNEAIDTKKYDPVRKYESDFCNFTDLFNLDDQDWEEILKIMPIFNRIGEIFTNNIGSYSDRVWNEVSQILQKKADELNRQIDNEIVKKWENVTKTSFGKDYTIVLFYAGREGPSWNNLSFIRTSVHYEKLHADMVSHEFGIHLMLPCVHETIMDFKKTIPRIEAENIHGDVSFMAFESLANFYNTMVMGREIETFDVENDYKTFEKIYKSLYDDKIAPKDMYKNGVKKYIELKQL